MLKILVVNLGSTSTKVAYYEGMECKANANIQHLTKVCQKEMLDQIEDRMHAINTFLNDNNLTPESIDVVSARGGLLKPIEGGTYEVNPEMIEDVRSFRYGKHASNLSTIIAYEYHQKFGTKALITDPVVVDELIEPVRMTGLKGIERISIFHALNQKAVARKYAGSINRNYEDVNVIVVHMGGGITVGAHKNGRVIDVNNGLAGEGPMSPTRAGSMPSSEFTRYILDNELSYDEVYNILSRNSGFISHVGTGDALAVENNALAGDIESKKIYEAMSVQIAKEIGARAAVLKGRVNAVLLTGGLAYSKYLTDMIIPYISFIADVKIYPGEEEMEALALGAYRVMTGREKIKSYK